MSQHEYGGNGAGSSGYSRPPAQTHQPVRRGRPDDADLYLSVDQGALFKRKRGRGRKSTSCIACNRRKQKCNSELPCLNCKTRGVADSCAYKNSLSPPASQPQSIRQAPYTPGLSHSSSGGHLEPQLAGRHPQTPSYLSPFSQGPGPSHDRDAFHRQSHNDYSRSPFMQPQLGHYPPRISDFHPSASFPHPLHSLSFGHSSRPTLPPPRPTFEKRPSGGPVDEDGHLPSLGRNWARDGASLTLPKLRLESNRPISDRTPERPMSSRSRDEAYTGHMAHLSTLTTPLRNEEGSLFDRSLRPFRDELEGGQQLWDLLSILPRKRAKSDLLVRAYLEQYNYHADVVLEPEFATKYEAFWSGSFQPDALGRIDLRWLSLLFIVFAFGVLLGMPQDASESERKERQESSWTWFWACRRSMTLALHFSGESIDLVRAGILISRFLVHQRRFEEAWSSVSAACRAAQAQGYNIDGLRWQLPPDQAELRRRLYAQLFALDRTLCLALRRPFAIVNQQSLTKPPHSLHDHEISAPLPATPRSVSEPTRTTYLILRGALSKYLGDIKERCYGLDPPSYEDVLDLDKALTAWASSLPEHYRLVEPTRSWDASLSFLLPHRRSLHAEFYFGVVTLHRPFVLLGMKSKTYVRSREACLEAASAVVAERSSLHPSEAFLLAAPLDFASCAVLALIATAEPTGSTAGRIVNALTAYMQAVEGGSLDVAIQLELSILRNCINRVRQIRSRLREDEEGDEAGTSPDREDAKSEPISTTDSAPGAAPSVTSDATIHASEGHKTVHPIQLPASPFSSGRVVGSDGISVAPWERLNPGSLLVIPEASNISAWDTLLASLAGQSE